MGFALSSEDILGVIHRFFPQDPNQSTPTGKGRLLVTSSTADAEVYIDGKFVGNAPSTFPLTAGDHVIEVKAPTFSDWKRTITVSEGSEQNIKAALQPQ